MDCAPEEKEAVRLLWEKNGGEGEIPSEEFNHLLAKVRDRRATIENHVVQDMLVRRLSEGRRVPRRHQVAAILALLIVGGVGALIGLIVMIWQSLT